MQLSKAPFNASPVQVVQLLCRQGKYFYLPRYQRPYAWTKANLEEFVSDVNGGLKLVIEDGGATKSALTFLGAAIFLPTNGDSNTIHPASNQSEAPQDIAVVIDGQQRITTLLMTCAALAGQLDALLKQVPRDQDPMDTVVVNLAKQLRSYLWKALGEDRLGTGDNAFHYYPRMIRENDDLWSSDERQARYKSPIAELLHQSLKWVHEREQSRWALDCGRRIAFETQVDKGTSTEFQACYKSLCDLVDGVSKGKQELQSPPTDVVFRSKTFTEILKCASNNVDESRLEKLRELDRESRGRRDPMVALVRTTIFAEYLRHRVYVTEVTAPDEENAFDLFQALNTRGEPLTAYETFKPVVMERVPRTAAGFHEMVNAMERIDNTIAGSGNSDREALTQQILIFTAAYESGHKLGKNIREQRRWLKGQLKVDDRDRKPRELVDFVLGIDRVALAHSDWAEWQDRLHRQELLPDSFHEGRLAAEVLADAKHTVVLPILTPFISVVGNAREGTEERPKAQQELERVLRALLATATLWRLAHGGTEGIDDALRAVMSSDAGISRRQCASPALNSISATRVIADLRARLAGGDGKPDLLDSSVWVSLAETQPIYQRAPKFAKIALAAAFHKATTGGSKPWILVDGRDPSRVELSDKAPWWAFRYNIEHLVPQSRGEESLKPEILHGLGNLTLVPTWVNSSLSDKEWSRKRRLFELMAERAEISALQFVDRLTTEGLLENSDRESLERIAREGVFQDIARAVAELPYELDAECIRARGRNILERAHARLGTWL